MSARAAGRLPLMRPAQRRDVTEFLPHVAAERRDLVDQLRDLDADAWATPSLCGSWTAHDVLAHLTFSVEISSLPLLLSVARARGDIDAVFDREARERAAALSPAALLERLRATADVPHRLGPVGELLLVATGRPAGLDALSGPGATRVADRMTGAARTG